MRSSASRKYVSASWSESVYEAHCVGDVRTWSTPAGLLAEHDALTLPSTPPPMPRHRNSTGQQNQREHHSSSPARREKKSLSSLDFELALWRRAADKRAAKKTQLEKRASLNQVDPEHLARNSADLAINKCCSSMVLPPYDAKQPAVLLQWKIIVALAIVSTIVVFFKSFALYSEANPSGV